MSVPIGIREDLRRDEGVRLRAYRDSLGKLTIGVGRDLEDVGITELEAELLLDHDIAGAARDLDLGAPWWARLSENRRRALLNMAFNLGWPRLAKFERMLAALKAGNWDVAAAEAMASRWAEEVGERAERIAALFRAG